MKRIVAVITLVLIVLVAHAAEFEKRPTVRDRIDLCWQQAVPESWGS